MTRLEAVNIVLRAIGENPVASLDIQYPTLDIALPALDECLYELLAAGWWFNTRNELQLLPDVDGYIPLPVGTIMFYPVDVNVKYEGSRLVYANTGVEVLSTPITGRLVTELEFEQLPRNAQYAVAYMAAYQVYTQDMGVDNVAGTLQQRAQGYQLSLGAEHTRTQQFTASRRTNVRRWLAALRT